MTEPLLSHQGHLTARDCKRHIAHPFAVPPDSAQLDVRLSFEPARANGIKNLITLTLFDPQGFRGAGHRGGAVHEVSISPDSATPGYWPGPLAAGEWVAQVDTHMVMPGETVSYTLEVTVNRGPNRRRADSACFVCGGPYRRVSYGQSTTPPDCGPAGVAKSQRFPPSSPRWYRGDLHTHTHHSDAHGQSVTDLLAAASDRGLDFLFLTDHNTNAGLAELETLMDPGLLVVPGIELTTFWGHALCLGTRRWWDWRLYPGSGAMGCVAEQVEAEGGLFVIAHPVADGDPDCTGCAWRFGEMMPGNARWVEIWNGPWGCDSNNESALSLWYDWLNQGLHVTATAGSDVHGPQHYAAGPGFSVLYAEDLTQEGLLRALREGHLYLSSGPKVDLTAGGEDGGQWRMGDTISQPVSLTYTWADSPIDAMGRIVVNGRPLHEWAAGTAGTHDWALSPDQANWVVVELRDGDGAMLAVTNPIYLEVPEI